MNRHIISRMDSRIITVGGDKADIYGFTSYAIQEAIENIKQSGGGTVKLEEAVYEVTAPIRLSDGITLAGEGKKTILRKCAGVKSNLTMDADYGQLQVKVNHVEGFSTDMGIQIYDENQQFGWAESTAVICGIQDNILYFNEYLQRDYSSDDGGMVTNACSIIEGVTVSDVHILDLVIDGNKEANEYIGGCRGGGIYLHKARLCSIERVEVVNFNGDGVSWQITEDIRVLNCDVSGCTGSGYHPGAGSIRTEMIECRSHHNEEDGLYICWRVQHGLFRNNQFFANHGNGISIGHQDTDNLLLYNLISENGNCGIYIRKEKAANGAHNNVIKENKIENNGSSEGGYGIYVNGYTHNCTITNNQISNTETGPQHIGIWLDQQTSDFVIENNQMEGHKRDVLQQDES